MLLPAVRGLLGAGLAALPADPAGPGLGARTDVIVLDADVLTCTPPPPPPMELLLLLPPLVLANADARDALLYAIGLLLTRKPALLLAEEAADPAAGVPVLLRPPLLDG